MIRDVTSGKASGGRGDQTLERPLRVLMVCPRYLPEVGGTEMHVHEVARRLSALGSFEITVLTTDRSRRLPRQEVVDGIASPACSVLAAQARLLRRPRDCGCDQSAQMGSRALPGHPHAGAIARHALRTAGRHPLSGHLPHRRPLVSGSGTPCEVPNGGWPAHCCETRCHLLR